MAGRWLGLRQAPGFLCVPLILEMASGAREPAAEAHQHIQFSAGSVRQTAEADVSSWAGRKGGLGGVSLSYGQLIITHMLCVSADRAGDRDVQEFSRLGRQIKSQRFPESRELCGW